MEETIQIKSDIPKGSVEAMDPFAKAPPGISLTMDNKKWAWGNPPQETNPEVVIEEATSRLDDPRFREDMMKLLMGGVSVEHIVESWVTDGFQNGKFSLDVGLLAKGPLGLYIAYIAEEEDIPYRMFELEDGNINNGRIDDESLFELMKMNNPNMFNMLREGLNKNLREG